AGRVGDAAALDRHRLHRARRFPGIAHLKPRGALAAAALAAALAAPFLFTGLGRAPFDDPGEGMHAEIARELAASGDPLRLTLDGVRYVDKPPLLYLLLASAFAGGGASQGTARAVAALAKDPLGALLPPVAVGLALAAAGRARPLGAWLPWPGVAALLVLGLAWYAAVALATPGFAWYTVVDNHVLNVARARRFPDED